MYIQRFPVDFPLDQSNKTKIRGVLMSTPD